VFPSPPHPPAASCASLIPALAFGVALEVDPVERSSEDPPPPVVVPLTVPTPTQAEADKPTPARVEAPRRFFRLGVSPWVDLWTAPRPAFGLSLDLGFRVAWFSLDLEGRWDPPAASLIHGAEVETSRVVGAFVPCGHVGYFAGCLLAEVDSLRGTVTEAGVKRGAQPVTYETYCKHPKIYATAGVRLSFEIDIAPRLVLRPALDLLLPLLPPSLRIAGAPRWEASSVSVRAGLGLMASF
jgi:hypothetical protein